MNMTLKETEVLGGCPFRGSSPHAASSTPAASMTYSEYLELDSILDAQHPLSRERSEMLFIIQHQTSELWMKLIIVESICAIESLKEDRITIALKCLDRICHVMQLLVKAWDVLSTLTPMDFLSFRNYLGTSSGYQSSQYRQIEFLFGNKAKGKVEKSGEKNGIRDCDEAPSIYDEVVRLMARRDLPITPSRLENNWSLPTTQDPTVLAAWVEIYRTPEEYSDLNKLGEALVQLEDLFRQWRFRHLTTVERIIGVRRGTGGSEGVAYLKKTLEIELFPELWHARTLL